MSDLIFKTTAKCETNMKTVVKARNFTIIIDEPESLGGSDHGANPVEYVQAALAGCLNVVGHIVAKEMGFEIKNMEIEIDFSMDTILTQIEELLECAEKIKMLSEPLTPIDSTLK